VITTVIPTLGRDTLYSRAIPSLLAQTVTDWRCIIVGDGVEVEAHDPRITTLSIPRTDYADDIHRWRVGGVRAFNHGLDHVETEWVSYLADDDEYLPNHHADLLRRAADDVDIVYGQSTSPGRNGHYGTHFPPDPFDICQGGYIIRASLGTRATETPGSESWDAAWWRGLLPGSRFARITSVVHVYHPAPETHHFHYR
jgi:glycosyltransferase involved in cell wall biosynthesis